MSNSIVVHSDTAPPSDEVHVTQARRLPSARSTSNLNATHEPSSRMTNRREIPDMPLDSVAGVGRIVASPVKLRLLGQQQASSSPMPQLDSQRRQQPQPAASDDEHSSSSQYAAYPVSAGSRTAPATPDQQSYPYRSQSALISPSYSTNFGTTPKPSRHEKYTPSSAVSVPSPWPEKAGLAAPAELETPRVSSLPGSSSRQLPATAESSPSTPLSANKEERAHRPSRSHRDRSDKDRHRERDKTTSTTNSQFGTLTKSTSTAVLSSSSPHSATTANTASSSAPPLASKDVKKPSLPSAILTPQTSIPWSISRPYWSKTTVWGKLPNRPMRAHTATLVQTKGGGLSGISSTQLWAFGGCDAKTCFRDMWKLDLDTFHWSKPKLRGSHPPSLRAHSATYIPPFQSPAKTSTDGHILYFGGGDGPSYFNDIYLLNLKHKSWTKPQQFGTIPAPRRAHTAVWYEPKKWLVVVGGGNGSKALNDTYVLECKNMDRLNWRKAETKGTKPKLRGYHTMNLIGDKAIVFGGSDGTECFSDVFVLQLTNFTWTQMAIYSPSLLCPRLSHSATLLSPTQLLILGGHDGTDYASSLIILNLETWKFEEVPHAGLAPSKRGYHSACYHDGRVVLLGGFDGKSHFDDAWTLDIGAWSALSR